MIYINYVISSIIFLIILSHKKKLISKNSQINHKICNLRVGGTWHVMTADLNTKSGK